MFVHNKLYSGFSRNVLYVLKYFEKDRDASMGKNDKDIENIFLDGLKMVVPNINIQYSKVYRVPYAEAIYTPDYKNMDDKTDGIYFTGIYKFYPKIRNMNSCVSEAKRIAEIMKKDMK